MQESRNSDQTAASRRSLALDSSDSTWLLQGKALFEHDPSFWHSYGDIDLYRLRNRLHASRELFAKLVGVSASTIKNWETGKTAIPALAQRLLHAIDVMGPGFLEMYASPEECKRSIRRALETAAPGEDAKLDERQASDAPDDFDRRTVKRLREMLGWRQCQLADAVGVSKSAVSRWESELNAKGAAKRSAPSPSRIKLLAQLWRKAVQPMR